MSHLCFDSSINCRFSLLSFYVLSYSKTYLIRPLYIPVSCPIRPKNLSLLDFPIDYSVKIPCLFRSLLEGIRIAANNRIMLAYRLLSPYCPNLVSGNHSFQKLS